MTNQTEATPAETTEAAAPAITVVDRHPESGFVLSNLVVATRLNVGGESKTVTIGCIPYAFPTLDNVVEGLPAPDSFEVETIESDGDSYQIVKPVYNNQMLNYMQTALREKVEAPIRAGKTITTDEDGQLTGWTITKEMVTDWPAILESNRAASYTYMEEKRDATNHFSEWLATTKLAAAAQKRLVDNFRSPDKIADVAENIRQGLEKAFSIWTGLLNEDTAAKFARHIGKVQEGLAGADEDMVFTF